MNERRSFVIPASAANAASPEGRWGDDIVVAEFFGCADGAVPGPQGFAIEMPPQSTSPTHFHNADQFQIFFPAPGAWYRKRTLSSVFLHYADAFMTYGPFGTGDTSMTVATGRSWASTLTAYMPRDRQLLPSVHGTRNIHVDLSDHIGNCDLAGGATIDTLVEPHDDGLAAYLVTAGPDAEFTTPVPLCGGGQYFCVLNGAVMQSGAEFTRTSLGYCEPGPTQLTITASRASGCQLLVLQLPTPTASTDLG